MKKLRIILLMLLLCLLVGCGQDAGKPQVNEKETRKKVGMEQKQGVFYEIFVRSFADSNGDGVGDFNGVTKHLQELKEFGIDGIWLMPIQKSDSYHGYDVTDYCAVNEEYGTEEDFKNLLDTAHKLGMKVTIDFVANHTSNKHPWFQEAVLDKKSPYRNYYHFASSKDKNYRSDALSPWGSKLWNIAGPDDYYYALFYEGMPDLNFDNTKVREELKDAAAYWLKMGVDGFRLDAALHIYGNGESAEKTNLTSANVQWWNEFGAYCELINPNVMLTGEVWSNEQVMESYAEPLDSKFDFTFASKLIKSVIIEDPEGLGDSLESIIKANKSVSNKYIDSVFASNHDQDRVMSRVEDIRKAKLVASIYLTVPGNPYIYYGEELGMYGSGPDEMRRTPYLFDKAERTTWEVDTQNKSVKTMSEQKKDPTSMYSHYKNLLFIREKYEALQKGSFKTVDMHNVNLMAYERRTKDEKLLVVHNFYEDTQQIVLQPGAKVVYTSGKSKEVKGKLKLCGYESAVIEY